MKLIKLMFFLLCVVNCSASPSTQKLLAKMKEINEALISVVNLPAGTKKQVAALERAKALVQESIMVDGITNNAALYAIGAILLDDPVYRERAAKLEKDAHLGKTASRIEDRHMALEREAEAYRQNLKESIEDIDMILRSSSMTDECRLQLETKKFNFTKTLRWVEAQIISHGMLATALYQHKMAQLSSSQMGESSNG